MLSPRSPVDLRRTSIDRDEHGLTGSIRGNDIYAIEDEELAAKYRFVACVLSHPYAPLTSQRVRRRELVRGITSIVRV